MNLRREICGVDVTVLTDGATILANIGGETMTQATIDALRRDDDWTNTVEIGPYTFDPASLAKLKQFVRSSGRNLRRTRPHAPRKETTA